MRQPFLYVKRSVEYNRSKFLTVDVNVTKKMLSFFYDLCLLVGLLLMLPRVLVQLWKKKRSAGSVWERFGVGIQPIDKGNRKLVWVHAVSLGETKAVAPLVERLRQTLDDPIIVVSSITATGHAEAGRTMPFATQHLFLPLDFSWIMRRLMSKIRPDVVIVTETDYWFNFLSAANEAGSRLIVVNGKLSERSTQRFCKLSFFSHKLFGLFDAVCAQSEEYRSRFESVGVASNKITVTGNLKFDATLPRNSPEELNHLRERMGLKAGQVIITAGSTHDPEERLFLQTCREIWVKHPQMKLLLVPRHPERFDEVARLLVSEGIPFCRYSDTIPSRGDSRVVLVDAMGVLKECYQLSDVAIVAGSFTSRVGGHNILEPCHYAVPVIFGPHMHAQPELERLMLQAGAGLKVAPDELSIALSNLFSDTALRAQLGQAGEAFITANRGAIARTVNVIGYML